VAHIVRRVVDRLDMREASARNDEKAKEGGASDLDEPG